MKITGFYVRDMYGYKKTENELIKGYKEEDVVKAIISLTGFSAMTAIVIYKILTASKVAFLYLPFIP